MDLLARPHAAAPQAFAPEFQPGLAGILVELLGDADKAIGIDHQAVRAFIGRAADLLQNETRTSRAPAPAGKRSATRSVLAPWQMRRVLGHIEANLPASIPLQDIAALTKLSVGHFSRAFKGSFGIAPHSYILRRRIERAQALMLQTEDSLCQIALVCGFCDQAHFSRLFRRLVGVSPNLWRRAHLESLPAGRIAA